MSLKNDVHFLQWVLPELGYKWTGYRKPRGQVIKRLCNRMQELKLTGGYDHYKKYLESNPSEWEKLDKMFDITISRFFRDRALWDYLRNDLMKNQLSSNLNDTLKIWSVGCCNGEEPYSVAIIVDMISEKITDKRSVWILATDRNEDVLNSAKRGEYPAGALRELTKGEIQCYFNKVPNGEEDYKIKDRLNQSIEFEKRDIRTSTPDSLFDLVFCRNLVFTYFNTQDQQQFLRSLKQKIKDGGFLIIGNNEELPETEWFESCHKSHPVYRKI